MASRNSSIVDAVGLVLLVAVGVMIVRRLAPQTEPPVRAGTPLPSINAEGWLNVPPDKPFNPAGSLLVVDLWATWCAPCRAELPRMATIFADYHQRGVKFVGATQETAADVPVIKEVIATTPGFDWPVAYGATEFFGSLDIGGIPTMILFGRDGKARWSGYGSYGLRQAIDAALAEEPAA